ncbi:MAG: SRPBCC family protein [Cyclobacteriaceae bacterium]
MPKINVIKSIKIDSPIEMIFNTLNDFNHWQVWSPWLIMEPEAEVKIAEDSKSYSWNGKRIGSGNMKVTSEEPHQKINYDLNFLKPWKSSAKVRFELEPDGDMTKVSWVMDSSLAFFMFWMKAMMQAFIGMDFERGLNMLKDYMEDGIVHSQLDFKGESTFPGFDYIGLKRYCNIDEMPAKMAADFDKINEFLAKNPDFNASQVFTIYHNWDMVKQKVSYTSGVAVGQPEIDLTDGFISGKIPKIKVFTLRHIGPYRHLGNAWSTLYNMKQGKHLKIQKNIHPFETYVNDPKEVPENDLITDIHFAIK